MAEIGTVKTPVKESIPFRILFCAAGMNSHHEWLHLFSGSLKVITSLPFMVIIEYVVEAITVNLTRSLMLEYRA